MKNEIVAYISYSVAVNILSFAAFGIDKKKAERKKQRISEMTLIILSIIGGAFGSLIGMVIFKHKLSKPKFYAGVPIIAVLIKILESFILYKIV